MAGQPRAFFLPQHLSPPNGSPSPEALPPHSGTKMGKDYFWVIYSNPLGKF